MGAGPTCLKKCYIILIGANTLTNKKNNEGHQHLNKDKHSDAHQPEHHDHHDHNEGHNHHDEHNHDHHEHSHHDEHEHSHDHTHYEWEEPGFVSLWLANITVEEIDETLIEYLQFDYDEDGNKMLSPFCVDFEIADFDEDYREAGILDEPKCKVDDLLQGCSYEEEVIPLFKKLIDPSLSLEQFNTVILLYNYHYHGKVKHLNNEVMNVVFIGAGYMQDRQ